MELSPGPEHNTVCLSHEQEFSVCMGNDPATFELYSKAVVKCSMMHVDIFGSDGGYLGLPCDVKELLGVR